MTTIAELQQEAKERLEQLEQEKQALELEQAQRERQRLDFEWEKAKNKLEITIVDRVMIRVLIWGLYIAATIQLFWPNLALVWIFNVIGIAILGITVYRTERHMRQEFLRNHPKP